jgi:signal transduction histidine kinase/ligand-binding sensor domain-containing protein
MSRIRVLLLAAALSAALASLPAVAQSRLLELYNHTAWSALDDAPADVVNIVQTSDSWLWLATPTGLFRFDGRRYERMDAISGHRLLSTNVLALYAPADGGLWVGYRGAGGISFFHDGQVTHYTEADGLPSGSVSQISRGPEGVIWAGTRDGLARLDGNHFVALGPEQGLPSALARQVMFDSHGRQWVSMQGGVYTRAAGQKRFLPAWPALDLMSLEEAPDGTIWASDGVANFYRMSAVAPAGAPVPIPALPGNGMHFDHDGNLWLLLTSAVEFRPAGKLDVPGRQLTPEHGLSGGLPQRFFEDREHNLWIGTSIGVDRLRRQRLLPVPGSSDFDHPSIAPAQGGGVWVGDSVSALRSFGSEGERQQLFKRVIRALYRDPKGVLWAGNDRELLRVANGQTTTIPLPPEARGYDVQAIASLDDGGLWVSVGRSGLYLFKDGLWHKNGGLQSLPDGYPLVLLPGQDGVLWAGYPRNQIVSIAGHFVTRYDVDDGVTLGAVLSLSQRDGQLWAGGELGVAHFDGKRFVPLLGRGGEGFRGVSGLVQAAEGDLWLFGADGLSHVTAVETKAFIQHPERVVEFERFDARDGVAGTPSQLRPLPSLLQGEDGLLWFATASKIGWLDPAHIVRNPAPPPVLVQRVAAGDIQYDALPGLRLPEATRNVRIDFTALSLSIPERVRFRYRLDGVDNDWQDPGTRRQAFYTNLEPGSYRFRVMAANEDGVWNPTEAQLEFQILPSYAQTTWFKLLCTLAAAALLYIAYQLRLQQVTRQLRQRMQARHEERERIARALHDTFLQSVQGLMLRFQTLLKRLPPDGEAHQLAEKILDQADLVLVEGRNQVSGLRSIEASGDIQSACALLRDNLREEFGLSFGLAVAGQPVLLTPAASEQVCQISREALLNAFQHAHAMQIELELTFANDAFRVVVRDNGRGMDAEVLQQGQRPGHWGLTGMRERAGQLDAALELWSRPGLGTEVRLVIPAERAYLKPPPRGLSQRISSWLSRVDAQALP